MSYEQQPRLPRTVRDSQVVKQAVGYPIWYTPYSGFGRFHDIHLLIHRRTNWRTEKTL